MAVTTKKDLEAVHELRELLTFKTSSFYRVGGTPSDSPLPKTEDEVDAFIDERTRLWRESWVFSSKGSDVMRCPTCNKFVPYDAEVEPEEQDAPSATDSTFTASYRRVLNCEECGEELKEATIEFEYDFSGDMPAEKGTFDPEKHEHEWEISCDVEPTTGAQTTDRNGRKIRNARYMKTLYGVSLDVELTCECGQKMEFDLEESCSASSMDELV